MTMATPDEGTIRFHYRLTDPAPSDVLDAPQLERLAAWRRVLKQLNLVGRDLRRYGGFAYGNLSVRDTRVPTRFFVTASQTGGAPRLIARDIARIDRWNATRFEVDATGVQPPSSESITHGMVYAADPAIAWIMHVHSAAIWHATKRLALPVTAADVAYGSPAMAHAVAALARRHTAEGQSDSDPSSLPGSRPLLFATLGHEDGVFACGETADTTGAALVRVLAKALLESHA